MMATNSQAQTVEAPIEVAPAPKTKTSPKTDKDTSVEKLPPYNVVLLDDDDHTYEYVIEMGVKLFGLSINNAVLAAITVDTHGRVVMCTTHKELAELKRDQVHSFGRDRLIAGCAGSMSAIIEPAIG